MDFYIADHSTKTLFELGKGGFRGILKDGALIQREELDAYLKAEGDLYSDDEYRNLVVGKLVAFCGERNGMELVNDSGDGFHDLWIGGGYDVVDSRYTSFSAEERKRYSDECRVGWKRGGA